MEIRADADGGQSITGFTAQVTAFIDPVLEFDQETFDARHGAHSFPLDQFFTIEQSPNVRPLDDTGPTVIPEPSSLALLGIGAVSLIGYAWRRRSGANA